MPQFYSRTTPGAPTFTAKFASSNSSGLDDFAPPVDADTMDREWYHTQDYYSDAALHPNSPLGADDVLTTVGFSYPAHAVPVSDALAGPLYPRLDRPMNGHAFPQYHDHGAPRVDELAPISPLQPQYNGGTAFPTPYPDSTASSAPSEDPIVADIEEDKRKRNQAASARFRQKKKQREQQMLEQTRDMQEKNKRLEGEVEGLKRENTFLKKLLVEKIDNMSPEDKALLVKTTDNMKEKD